MPFRILCANNGKVFRQYGNANECVSLMVLKTPCCMLDKCSDLVTVERLLQKTERYNDDVDVAIHWPRMMGSLKRTLASSAVETAASCQSASKFAFNTSLT